MDALIGSNVTPIERDATGEDGFLKDITLVAIDDAQPRRENRSRDIERFFSEPFTKDGKKHRKCRACLCVVHISLFSLFLFLITVLGKSALLWC
jgi:hypothetical protein